MKLISILPLTIAFAGWTPAAFAQDFALLRSNGIQVAYLEAGERGAPLVICLHGFPDDAFTFSELMPALASRGYHVVAPFTRGYYPTEIPANGDYSIETLAEDALELIDSFGASDAIVIGHDWGAITGYAAANIAPDRVKKLVALAIPHPRVLYPSRAQLRASSQFLELPWGKSSEKRFTENDFKYVDDTFTKWSPTWSGPVLEAQRVRMKVNFARPGRAAAALGYYRSFRKDLTNPRRVLLYRKKTSVPTLTIHGELDGATLQSVFVDTPKAFTGTYRLVEIPGAGHFVHLEAPERVNAEILEFLGSASSD